MRPRNILFQSVQRGWGRAIFRDGIILLVVSAFASCGSSDPISLDEIHVVVKRMHPIFSDHDKSLEIRSHRGWLIDDVELYADAGSGSPAFLFEEADAYVLIDCDGHWYGISKSNGGIDQMGWNWEQPLPEVYLGEYQWNGSDEYVLKKNNKPDTKSVYLFKDPG